MPSDHQHLVSDTPAGREARLNIRTTAKQDTLIRLAAQASNKTVTDFVLDSASSAAERILADRRWFMLDDAAWVAFQDMLERPTVVKPKLRKLLTEPTVFDTAE